MLRRRSTRQSPQLAHLTFRILTGASTLALTLTTLACSDDDDEAPILDADQEARLRDEIGVLGPPPASPSNAVADDEAAAELGRALFFDAGLSASGSGLSCASCHLPEIGWSDERALSLNAEGAPSNAHSPTLTNVAYQPWMFWNGRADSLWSQARAALIGVHKITPVDIVLRLGSEHREAYEAVFPDAPLPTDPLTADDATLMGHVVLATKAIEAFERQIVSRDAPIDHWIAGDSDALDEGQLRGAKVFLEAGCITCHGGPNFSDGWFHNVGVGLPDVKPTGAPDGMIDQAGADVGLQAAIASEFSIASAYSDDPAWGQTTLDDLAAQMAEGSLEGAFKTPTLRDVALRPRLGHLGRVDSLRAWIGRYVEASVDADNVGALDPAYVPVPLTEAEIDDLLLFLDALTGSPSSAELGL